MKLNRKEQLEWEMTCIIDDITAYEDGHQNDLTRGKVADMENELAYILYQLDAMETETEKEVSA